MEFPPVSWIIPNIVAAEGVTLLCSRPKFGKSWLVLDLCITSTMNRIMLGEIVPAQGDVLYLALEDSKRRLQRRMRKLLPTFGGKWSEKLTLKTEWRRLHEGGLEDIEAWHADTKAKGGKPILVVIDVLAKVRKPAGKAQLYEADYAALSDLCKLANELGIAIIVVHHTRKMAADDLMETVNGSFGITGAVDTILVMAATASGKVLDIRGRDVQSEELAIEFDKNTCRWRVLGNAQKVRVSAERAKIMKALKEAGEPTKINTLIEETGMKRNPLEVLLGRMAKQGEIQRVGKGSYAHADYVEPARTAPEKSKNSKAGKGAASVQPPTAQTDGETDAPSAQKPKPKGRNVGICPSVSSVQERTDKASPETVGALCVPAQTDRTDGQFEIESLEPTNQFDPGHLSNDLSSRQGQTDGRQSAAKSDEKGDDLLGIPPFLRRPLPAVASEGAPTLELPDDSLDALAPGGETVL
jgi:hypothetical protein